MADSQSTPVVPQKPQHHKTRPIAVGSVFGRLTVVGNAEPIVRADGRRNARSLCECQCGKTVVVLNHQLRRGGTQSCKCLRKERIAESLTTHGHTIGHANGKALPAEYHCWASMWDRVRNSAKNAYSRYGGRGITVCDRWRDFATFLSDMGEKPSPDHSIDRINNDGNYEPGNCRWATRVEQANNTSANRRLTLNGETLTVAEWSRRSGITAETIRNRLKDGFSDHDAVWMPRRKGRSPCPKN